MPKHNDGLSVTESLMYSTVRIVADVPGGQGFGTGSVMRCFYEVPPLGRFPFLFVITNKHVVENATKLTLLLHQQENNQFSGADAYTLDDPATWIVPHPDTNIDLAAIVMMPLMPTIQKKPKPPFFCGY